MSGIRVALPGAAGKMGRTLQRVIAETDGLELSAAVEREGHPLVGQDAHAVAGLPPGTVQITDSLDEALTRADVLIDFTTPAASALMAPRAAAAGVPIVVGTTGLGEAELAAITRAAKQVAVMYSPNMSVGVNVLLGLVEVAAAALGDSFDVEIVEAHHRLKRDSPSGTALKLAEVIARALHRELPEVGVYGRKGEVGARTEREIGVLAVRGGDVIGDHTAHFLGLGERIEITHRASSRETFARGAVRAAAWLRGQNPGLYDMRDVLGLRR